MEDADVAAILFDRVFDLVRRAGPSAEGSSWGDLMVDVEAALPPLLLYGVMEELKPEDEKVVARALSLPEDEGRAAVSELAEDDEADDGDVNGTKDKEARPSRDVSSEALGLVCSDVNAEMDGSFFFRLLVPPGDALLLLMPLPLPAVVLMELLLFCTKESGCLLGD